MVTRASDINTDPGYPKAIDPDMTFSCISGQNITKALGISTGLSELYVPGCIMVLRHQHGFG